MTRLTGINSGIIKSEHGVLAIVLKVSTSSEPVQLLYLPPDQFQELMFATVYCYHMLQQSVLKDPDGVKAQVLAESQALEQNILPMAAEELNNPQVDLKVTNFVLKRYQDHANFLFFMYNGSVVTLTLSLHQAEYMINVLVTTVNNSGDEQLAALCLGTIDFIPMFTVDFAETENKGINYNQFTIADWKADIFDTVYSIVYIQTDGYVPCGALFKAAADMEPARLEAISKLLIANNTLLKRYKEGIVAFDYTKLALTSTEENMEILLGSHLAHRNSNID